MALVTPSPNVNKKVKRTLQMEGVDDAETQTENPGSGLHITRVQNMPPHIYNNNYTVRLTYSACYKLTTSPGGGDRRVFRMNSIFDPDFLIGGHQPLGHDIWAGMYDYYSVLACDYDLEFYNGTVDTVTATATEAVSYRHGAQVITLMPTTRDTDVNTSNANYVYPITEMKNAASFMLTPDTAPIRKTGRLQPQDFIVDAIDADTDSTWTQVGQNPTVGRYLGVMASHVQESNATGQNKNSYGVSWLFAKLHYTVQFTQVNPDLRQVPS